jgi:hypothetical protein
LKPLRDVRAAIETWLRNTNINTAPDVVPKQGVVSHFTCTHHQNWGGGDIGLTHATFTVRVYVSRADIESAQQDVDDAQTVLFESLESAIGPWYDLTITSSSVAEETSGDARYVVVVLSGAVYV